MNFSYSKQQWSRGGAWRDLIKTNTGSRAVYIYDESLWCMRSRCARCGNGKVQPFRFIVRQHDYRKMHSDASWRWAAARLQLSGGRLFFEAPCPAPESEEYTYVWDVWIDPYRKTPACGFVTTYLVDAQALSCQAEVEDALVEQDRRMVEARGGGA